MRSRRTIIIFIVIFVGAGVFGYFRYQQWTRQGSPADPNVVEWIPLSHLEAAGDVVIITGTFGGMATDERFLITTTRQVTTTEGTYADTSTRIVVIGPDTSVQSAATGAVLDITALTNLSMGSQVNILVQKATQNAPVVNAYLVIIP